MRSFLKSTAIFMIAVAMVVTGSTFKTTTAFAANTEVQGTTDDSESVEVTANITSVYSISLPASINLSYGNKTNIYVGGGSLLSAAEGYFGVITFGCAGKISAQEHVYIEPVFPCTMTGVTSGSTLALKKVLNSARTEPKTQWTSSEIGTCTYNGISLTNCVYAYNDGLTIGFLLSDVSSYETYTSNLLFNFGIRAN